MLVEFGAERKEKVSRERSNKQTKQTNGGITSEAHVRVSCGISEAITCVPIKHKELNVI